jgi:hypothetical protein
MWPVTKQYTSTQFVAPYSSVEMSADSCTHDLFACLWFYRSEAHFIPKMC